jgi:PAS domain S-box-containing protein
LVRVHGTTLEEMQGLGWRKVYHPDYVEAVTRRFREHVEAGEPWEDTFPIRGADGEYRWFLSRAFRRGTSRAR